MATEIEIEVYRALRTAQEKYTYFLLAAAGAAIGLAINQTHDAGIHWSQAPLGAAVLCFGLSFYFGCRHALYGQATLHANAALLRIQRAGDTSAGADPEHIAAASDARAAAEHNSEMGNRFARLQFSCLITGGVFYLAWHMLEMYLRS